MPDLHNYPHDCCAITRLPRELLPQACQDKGCLYIISVDWRVALHFEPSDLVGDYMLVGAVNMAGWHWRDSLPTDQS